MRVLMCGLATMYTEPPWPPSPPLGPPRGTNFSRRNARHPRPPCPAATWMSTSSTNIGNRVTGLPDRLGLLGRKDADDAALGAVIFESHPARDLGVDRIVFAASNIQAGAEAAAALAHDDGAAAHEVAVVRFDAQPLRVGVAAVA